MQEMIGENATIHLLCCWSGDRFLLLTFQMEDDNHTVIDLQAGI